VLSLYVVRVLVLDEADRLLDMGFWPDLEQIRGWLPEGRQGVLLSATMPTAVAGLAAAFLSEPVKVEAEEPAPPLDRIVQQVYYVRKADKHQLLAHVLEGRERVMVFTRTRSGADRAVELLASRGRVALGLHGEKSQSARRAALAAFRAGEVGVLVATDVAARGLDVEGVGCVVSFDLPSEPETYIHRVGRTGRMGQGGCALALCDLGEHSYLQAIEALCGRPLQPVLDHPFYDHDLLPAPPGTRRSGKKPRRRRR
jgi:ATP-dependent RNA helicase RhlE